MTKEQQIQEMADFIRDSMLLGHNAEEMAKHLVNTGYRKKEEIEKQEIMTNREYLKTLSNEEFARAIATKVATTQEPNFSEGLKYTEIINDIQIDFEEWLNEEHKE